MKSAIKINRKIIYSEFFIGHTMESGDKLNLLFKDQHSEDTIKLELSEEEVLTLIKQLESFFNNLNRKP